MLKEEDKVQIKKRLEEMDGKVTLLVFSQQVNVQCQYCSETETLVNELVALSDKLEAKILNFVTDKEEVEKYDIEKIPAIVIKGEKDHGIRYYGIPAGYEFATLLDTILMVSKGESQLSEQTKTQINDLKSDVHIQVFVTPTCPYCPRAAITAYQLAMENEHIKAETIEVSEFPHLGQKYGVMGVPKIVINETQHFEGALPESTFVQQVMTAVQ